ncbi:MAG: hypothetical protein LBI87_02780 [Candidatus Accumulibacter sp.]|nr:hypothetical protein [Accumulibacter sp.]
MKKIIPIQFHKGNGVFMKKAFWTAIIALVIEMTACDSKGNNGGSTTTPPSNSGGSQTAGQPTNNGGDTAGWRDSFAKASGIPNLPIPSNCEVDTGKTSSSKVTFTAKAEVTEDEFKAYAKQVFEIVKSASPDGNYKLSETYDSKGDAYGSFGDVPSSSKMTYWYYTRNDFIKQISIDGKGSTLIIKINDVYNPKTQERVKP